MLKEVSYFTLVSYFDSLVSRKGRYALRRAFWVKKSGVGLTTPLVVPTLPDPRLLSLLYRCLRVLSWFRPRMIGESHDVVNSGVYSVKFF